jgi:outer membrane protein
LAHGQDVGFSGILGSAPLLNNSQKIMKRILFSFAFITILALEVSAQADSSYTLKHCIDYALLNASKMKNAKLDEYIAEAKVGEIKADGLPQIKASAGISDNPTLKRMFLRGDNDFVKLKNTQADPDQVYAIQNLFQLRSAADANITANQLVFSGAYLVGLKASKVYLELSSRSLEKTRLEVIEAVKKAFYLTLINRERLNLLQNNIIRLDSLFAETKAMQQNGFAEKIDVDRIEVSYNNLVTEKQKFDNLYALSFLLLKYQMGMPVNQPLSLKGNISEIKAESVAIITGQNMDYSRRVEYSLLQIQKKGDLLQLKRVRAGYLPTVSVFGTLGTMTMHYKVTELFSTRSYAYNMYGINLNMPLFEGFKKSYQAKQAKLTITKTENSLYDLKNSIDLQVQQNELSLKNYQKTLEAQKRNLELSTEVSRISKIKYQEGVGSNIEVITAENALKESQTNYYNALYDLLVANVDYQKSLGTLGNE